MDEGAQLVGGDEQSQDALKNRVFFVGGATACHAINEDGGLLRLVSLTREGEPYATSAAISQYQEIFVCPDTPYAALQIAIGAIRTVFGEKMALEIFDAACILKLQAELESLPRFGEQHD